MQTSDIWEFGNESEPGIIGRCCECKEPIYEGEHYYDFRELGCDKEIVCYPCLRDWADYYLRGVEK